MSQGDDQETRAEEGFEIEVKKGEYSLRLKGFKPLAQVSQYAADTLGVIGEPLGLLKDKLHNYRINQVESAAAAIMRAEQILKERGKEPEPVAQKVLIPWIEGASAEDLTDENILDLWAKLLANSSSEFSSETIAVVEFLKRIGPSEAELVNDLVNLRSASGMKGLDGQLCPWVSIEQAEIWNEHYLEIVVPRVLRSKGLVSADVGLDCNFRTVSCRLNGHISDFSISHSEGGKGTSNKPKEAFMLDHLGITRKRLHTFEIDGIRVSLTVHYTTEFGIMVFEMLCRDQMIESGANNMEEFYGASVFLSPLGRVLYRN